MRRKETVVKHGIKKVLELNELPMTPSRLQGELQEVMGIEASWDTVKKYAEELVDEGKIRKKTWDTEEYEKVAYL